MGPAAARPPPRPRPAVYMTHTGPRTAHYTNTAVLPGPHALMPSLAPPHSPKPAPDPSPHAASPSPPSPTPRRKDHPAASPQNPAAGPGCAKASSSSPHNSIRGPIVYTDYPRRKIQPLPRPLQELAAADINRQTYGVVHRAMRPDKQWATLTRRTWPAPRASQGGVLVVT